MVKVPAIEAERPWGESVIPHALVTLTVALLTAVSHFRPEYVAITVFWLGLTVAGPRARKFLSLAVPILLVGLLYDKILPLLSSLRGEIHVRELYDAELRLFGIATASGLQTPAAWFQHHTSPILDVPCGFGYIAFMYESFILAAWLFFSDQARASRFVWAFLLVNVMGMACELLYPAAPPWYIDQYGLGPARLDAVASAAGAIRFDEIFGIHFFSSFYARSQDVFGAMPSLHVAYPVLVTAAVWNARPRWLKVPALAFAGLVGFAAVYLNHHFVLDVLAGIVAALLAHGVIVLAMAAPAAVLRET